MATIACVFAHPDDEAFGPGGTIAKLVKDKNEIHIICCTDGDHQKTGLKDVRNKELLDSARILGVTNVTFLEFVDGELSNNKYSHLAKSIKSELDKLHPNTIITFDPNGVSGHLDHITVTSIVNYLFPQLPYVKKIMYYCLKDVERAQISDYFVYMPDGRKRTEVNEIVDISSVWDVKVSAMHAHVSQKSDCDWILNILSQFPKEEWFLVRSR
ncbi:hypothetical protein A2899_00930 [Candidatus Amesbacteria bacterium RIFCSPLOWO2_01_FULL_49_25]|uniref:GlcNAc-PI de-N-acetylase n=1 Tax=Candidatus Amesbacteria bacterium RIFCSPHIGHO2_01_FULL_48_32b TaxID=1797253 RepID=A0A1F4YFI7_9BACT|nr:MAG: hypothetical protein A2876_00080 [Candidatus Amesbacteria bacterium RIFCSPHIGHO2_01_FULL_48_32b]OGD07130.1 MAG: hypothetical protein A2899_00930 [Candidatus Amesbacteria bacterium RIFCSPLOWO2_01_FULL_49_25]